MDICAKCGEPASLKCGGCGDVSYCSKEHQKVHWKKEHKGKCKAYKIESHPDFGRYLVASRDLKPGARILAKISPALTGPPLRNPNPVCLACNNSLQSRPVICPGCKFPFCAKKCQHANADNMECQFLSRIKRKNVPGFEVVSPARFWLLRTTNPDLFQRLIQFESHIEDIKKNDPDWPKLKSDIVDPLVEAIVSDNDNNQDLSRSSVEDMISQMVGIIATNNFELMSALRTSTCTGLFELASLMNHDCVGNTR